MTVQTVAMTRAEALNASQGEELNVRRYAMRSYLQRHTVPELKAAAKTYGLPVSGTKAELIERHVSSSPLRLTPLQTV